MHETDISCPNWIKSLKAGDKVIVSRLGGYPQIEEVRSVGKRLISLKDCDTRFNIETGMETGNDRDWRKACLVEATLEAIAQIQEQTDRQQILHKIQKAQIEKLPLSALKEIEAIIQSHFSWDF